MKPRKPGERVRHINRPDLGDGHVTHLYGDGHCDVAFPNSTFSWVELSAFQSIEAEAALQELDRLLYNGEVEQADSFYEAKCAEYLNLKDFEQRKATAQAAYEQRVAREHTALHDEVARSLDEFEFTAADDLYAARCASWWPLAEYEALRAHAACVFEQLTLRDEVMAHLSQFEFEVADGLYATRCAAWWPLVEYEASRTQAVHVWTFVQKYPSASLSELDSLYVGALYRYLSPEEYALLKLPKLRLRLARMGMPLDEEQLFACARPERNRVIRARAGSGKTRTLAATAAMAIHDETLNPDRVLILAFNKKAAHEIGERVREVADVEEFRNARTFHSLAWQLADHAGRDLIFDDGSLAPSRRKQSGFVERLVTSIMNPEFRESLYEFFRREIEQLDRLGSSLSKEEYATFRRALADYTLGGETVKSSGEKFIADFLFEHDIAYKYEKVWSWERQERLHGTPYRPDFSIVAGGKDFILEHWAINPDDSSAEVPVWWETRTVQYREQIEAKRNYWKSRRVVLLETHADMLAGGREPFESSLKKLLELNGIRCRKVDHDVLVQRIAEAPRTVSRLAALFLQFISRAKKRGWTVEDVARVVGDAPDPVPRSRVFHELAVRAYAAYEQRLIEQRAMDFDDLLISATKCVRKHGGAARLQLDGNKDIAIRDLRWILIDEFQDFSALYYRLIRSILDANPSIRIVAVGDDWQAINGFAGAQLSFFNDFSEYFPESGEAIISTNYRSGLAIVGVGNKLMEGLGVPAHAKHTFRCDINIVPVDKIRVEDASIYVEAASSIREGGRKRINWDLAKALAACADDISKSVCGSREHGGRRMPSVLLLARTGNVYGVTLAEFSRRLEEVLLQLPDLQELSNDFAVGTKVSRGYRGTAPIEVMTAHTAKGKEADTVIVLEAVMRQFPKVHADNQLFSPFGVTAKDVLAEERRLFYVATTRAKRRLTCLTENSVESQYLEEMRIRHKPEMISGGVKWRLGKNAQAIKAHLDPLDGELLVMQNVSVDALSGWKQLAQQSLGLPEVGFSLSGGLYAELAWPEHRPPIAVLTGRHRNHAASWRERGWEVH